MFTGQLTAGGGGDDDRCALLPHSTGPSGCNSASGHPMALKSKYGDLSNVGDLKTARINHRQDSQSPPFTVRRGRSFCLCELIEIESKGAIIMYSTLIVSCFEHHTLVDVCMCE